jgi:hypothetical protein
MAPEKKTKGEATEYHMSTQEERGKSPLSAFLEVSISETGQKWPPGSLAPRDAFSGDLKA